MKIQPVAGPAAVQQTTTNETAAKARAVAAFQSAGQQQPQQPVRSQNAIQPEEMGAIGAQKDSSEDEVEQGAESQAPESSEAAPEAQEQTPAAKPLSEQHLALIRREKAIRAQAQKQEQAFKAREAALAQREAELSKTQAPEKPDYSGYISKDMLKSNALQALAEANVSYEELTQQILNQGTMDPRAERMLANMEAKIQKLEAAAEEGKKREQTAQEEQYSAAVKQIETDVKKMITIDPEYEMIKVTGSYKDVVDLIKETWNQKGELLTNEEAARQVEEYLVEEAEKLAKIEKIRKRLNPAASTQAKTTQVQQPSVQTQKQAPQMKTLTNTNSVSRQLSARERALLAFKGEKF